MFVLFALATVAAAREGRKHHRRGEMTMVGGCTVKGPGVAQTPATTTANGAVDGVSVHTEIYKDGFWMVGCMGDEMVTKGDKHGDGKFAYEEGAVYNTSIVMYDVQVERENQEAMTPQVCFDFCRSVPNMVFFGLIHGRDCYCTHFYKTTTGDGTCDLPCEGDSATICGGETMSTLYQMHECEGSFAAEVGEVIADSEAMADELYYFNYDLEDIADWMQASGDLLESYTEGSASYLAQAAKEAAGPVRRAAEDCEELDDEFDSLKAEYKTHRINPAGDLSHEERKITEDMMAETKETIDAAEQAIAAAETMTKQTSWLGAKEGTTAGETYVPIMRQVDAEKEGKQSVCGGDLTGMPKVGMSYNECAQACDDEAPKSSDDYCWAIEYVTFPDQEPLCFLLKDITEVTTYNCDYAAALVKTSSEQGVKKLFLEKKHHKHHRHHHHKKAQLKTVRKHRAKKLMRHEREPMLSHRSTHFVLSEVHHKAKRGPSASIRTDTPMATCAVRFADVNGVTPELKDGLTTIDRCFAVTD